MLTSRITDAAAAPNLRAAKLEHSAHEQLDAACLLPYYFAVCRLARGRPLRAVQYVGRTYIAPERGTTAHYARRSRNSRRVELHAAPLTRREMSGEMGMHSKPPPDIRRRTMHSIAGALV